ncbi:Retrotransposon protein [Musa troglodytarum]|uniref:Retrotransposon protein n=1 Tax=Musa troglodytarum TaxID=320322 RepID=A0A9E7EEG1_9LILI|nr:Retrotransposon protein [Musa troglodytarum]
MDLDLALREDQPTSLTDNSTPNERRLYEKWDRSNRMCLMIIKCGIPEAFRATVSEGITKAKDFLTEIEKHFLKNDKVKTSTILQSLISMRYNGKGNIREYIIEMSNLASKLKVLKLGLSLDLLVHLVLISLLA